MREARLKKLAQARPLVAASLVTQSVTCGRPQCRCAQGHKHLKHVLTFKKNGKTQTVYVPLDLLPEVRQWVAEHQRIKQLLREISELSLDLIRSHVKYRKLRQGRD
jgi:hypothetical protein